MIGERTRQTRALFDGIAARYDRPAGLLSFGQYRRWRRALVQRLDLAPDALVLDVATGTGLIARDVARRYGSRVVGLDQSASMLDAARSRGLAVAGGQAERLPFPDGAFDCVTFSYLLRYVDDPSATVGELARVLRPGGVLGSVEFGVPRWIPARAAWRVYSFGIFPRLARRVSPGWAEVAAFLPASIATWAADWPPERQSAMWRGAGIENVRWRDVSLGAGVVMSGRKRGA